MTVNFARQDLQFALRLWRKTPGFALAAVGTLALAIGANTAIFSVVSGVLLRPLPFPAPERLVQINEVWPRTPLGPVTYQDLDAWRSGRTSFEGVVAYGNLAMNLEGIDEPQRVAAVASEHRFFRLLGAAPLAGRTFRDDDPPHVVIVS